MQRQIIVFKILHNFIPTLYAIWIKLSIILDTELILKSIWLYCIFHFFPVIELNLEGKISVSEIVWGFPRLETKKDLFLLAANISMTWSTRIILCLIILCRNIHILSNASQTEWSLPIYPAYTKFFPSLKYKGKSNNKTIILRLQARS